MGLFSIFGVEGERGLITVFLCTKFLEPFQLSNDFFLRVVLNTSSASTASLFFIFGFKREGLPIGILYIYIYM